MAVKSVMQVLGRGRLRVSWKRRPFPDLKFDGYRV